MTAAFAYLIYFSTRNKLVSQVKRLQNPRYAIAMLLGIGYFWMVFFSGSRNPAQSSPVMAQVAALLLPMGILLYAAYIWIFGTDRDALAFTQAEVSMLFTAPVSRRGLIIYKLARAQAAVLMTSLVWLVIFRSGNDVAARVASSWVFLSIFSMHRLGVALVRSSATEHGLHALRRNWLAAIVFFSALVIVGSELLELRTVVLAAGDRPEVMAAFETSFRSAPLSWVLYPFRLATAPMFTSGSEWIEAMIPALILLVLHVWWVLRSDAAFEEAAAEASAAQAKRIETLRTRGVTGASVVNVKSRLTFPLGLTGPPSVAIIWKNYLWLVRTGMLRTIIGFPAVALVCAVVFAGRSEVAEVIVVAMCVAVGVMVLLFGPMVLRNDLRGELRRLPTIKTLPLTGRQIVLAEVLSSASPIAAMQFFLLLVGLIALGTMPKDPLTTGMALGLVLGAPALLLGLNVANFMVHNALAVLFPAWVKLGETGVAGIEAIGQSMLTIMISVFGLAVLLVVPAVAGGVGFLSALGVTWLGLAAAGTVGGATLLFESYLLMEVLGRSLDRLEPTQVG